MLETWAVAAFWCAAAAVLYPYLGYPLALALWARLRPRPDGRRGDAELPAISMIVPVHNEAARLERKIANIEQLQYPADRLDVLFVSDGSTDGTVELLERRMGPSMRLIALPARGGKAAGLNAGLAAARHEILVFTDAAIDLEPGSVERLVRRFADPAIGCVSGEDRIADAGGEGLYGRYELLLRRLETAVHSIVGASGSFYAQRKAICRPFTEGMAPDFLSVLRTVEAGYRAVSAEDAVGTMTSLSDPRREYERKVRTLIRGMTTLFAHARLLNPVRYGAFAFVLWSHKIMRWAAPFFLAVTLLAPLALLDRPFYLLAFVAQVVFYLLAGAAARGLPAGLPGRIAVYFVHVHAALVAAWVQYGRGVRQEIWTPSQRP
jgi:cellulose synthase/poly-beta-1,6-N-acetylglucosamine synthase-like glycosyltransferase